MKVVYDLHVHSGLSPCADDDMTPCTIVGLAKLNGLDMIAVSDHNSVLNVKTAMKAGEYYGITVVPAMELQTSEDIHVLCLFKDYPSLLAFYESVEFYQTENRPDIFGNQYVYDEDDEITGEEKRLLINGSALSCSDVYAVADSFGGVAVPAHVDREENGMVAVLGTVTSEFTAVELSLNATEEQIKFYERNFKVIIDSDAHTLRSMSSGRVLDLPEISASALVDYLKK